MNLSTPKATTVVGALALVLIAAASWMFLLGPVTDELAVTRAEIETTRAQNDTLRAQLEQLRAQSEELDGVRETARALAAKFPPTADQPGLFEAVTAAAVDAGIGADGVTTLAPSPPVVGGVDPATGVATAAPADDAQLARQTVTVSAEGSYAETQALLANLEAMPRAYLVSSVSLSGGTEGGFTTTVVGDMFVMPPLTDPADVEPAR